MTTTRSALTPSSAPPRAFELLGRADSLLSEAACVRDAESAERFRLAYLAALRGAAAVLAARPCKQNRRKGSGSAWALLMGVAPELSTWAAFFADHSARRIAIEAGVTGRVTSVEADQLLREAERFLDVVEDVIEAKPGMAQAG
ncbi:SAV_6107 family HEPN domain-containing protein [Tomitella biformata]|uniref:SAV_6107 family HEPN domain-containing protein n=1 Tax=Tomitella biformata TaxID=630403 RepID=UPI0004648AFB|nr:SAV_6107 family HEPN domain-containing protein [Tomitella biformata]